MSATASSIGGASSHAPGASAQHVAGRIVRDARPEDAAAIATLLHGVGEFTKEEVEVALELVEDSLAKRDDYRVVVAFDHDRLAGYACFGPTPMTKGCFDLYWIASSSGARRSGVGRALVDGLVERVRTSSGRLVRVETSSRAEYAATRRFYERAAFSHAATITGFYDVDDDLMVYVRYV